MKRWLVRSPPVTWRSAARTHRGCVRLLNEDSYLARPEIGLWAIADGMGGHAAGDVASALMIETLESMEAQAFAAAPGSALRARAARANADLMQLAAHAEAGVIGTTLVTLVIRADRFLCLWAGDSRAYRLRGARLTQLTRDHTLAQELADARLLEANAVRYDRRAHVITRAVGARAALDLACAEGRIEWRDRYLLCSDGLSGAVNDEAIRTILVRERDLQQAADALLAAALAAGARDNVTLTLIEAEEPDRSPGH